MAALSTSKVSIEVRINSMTTTLMAALSTSKVAIEVRINSMN